MRTVLEKNLRIFADTVIAISATVSSVVVAFLNIGWPIAKSIAYPFWKRAIFRYFLSQFFSVNLIQDTFKIFLGMVDVTFQTSARLAKVNVLTDVTLLGRNVKLGADLFGNFHLAIHFIEFACFVVLDNVVAFAIGKEVWSLAMFRFVVEVKIIFDPFAIYSFKSINTYSFSCI